MAKEPLGLAIKVARIRARWTQKRLAQAIPVACEHLSRWETGVRTIPLTAVVRISDLLHDPTVLDAACRSCPVEQARSGKNEEVAS